MQSSQVSETHQESESWRPVERVSESVSRTQISSIKRKIDQAREERNAISYLPRANSTYFIQAKNKEGYLSLVDEEGNPHRRIHTQDGAIIAGYDGQHRILYELFKERDGIYKASAEHALPMKLLQLPVVQGDSWETGDIENPLACTTVSTEKTRVIGGKTYKSLIKVDCKDQKTQTEIYTILGENLGILEYKNSKGELIETIRILEKD